MEADRSASFVELFFDLVFVFGITQVVASIHGHVDWPTLGRAAVVLALLWWAWSQYTWLAGWANFEELKPRLVLLVATAGAFVLAVAVQGAWNDDGRYFGLGYFGVVGLAGISFWIQTLGTDQIEGVLAYVPRMMAGSALVAVGGFFDGDARLWLWAGGVFVNLLSATIAGRYEFRINGAHFAERHGLFVIIVMGEALIAIGAGTVGHPGGTEFYVAGTAMLLTALAMWWSYFDRLFRVGERALKGASGVAQGLLARDAYTIGHYPLIAGVILFAVGTEELLAHPELALGTSLRWAFVGGLLLFVGSQLLMARRLTGSVAWERLVLLGLLGLVGSVLGSLSAASLSVVVCLVLMATLGLETARHREPVSSLR